MERLWSSISSDSERALEKRQNVYYTWDIRDRTWVWLDGRPRVVPRVGREVSENRGHKNLFNEEIDSDKEFEDAMPLLSQQAKKFHKKGKGKVTCSQIDSNDEFESNMPLISQWAKSDNKNDPIRNKTSKRKLEQIENSVSTSICAIQHNDSEDEFVQPKTKGCHRSKSGKCFPKKSS